MCHHIPSPLYNPEGIENLISKDEIDIRVAELGEKISQEYLDRQPILIGILKGVVPFISDLMRQMSINIEVDFMSVSRPKGYGHPDLVIEQDVKLDITGRHVIVVEDIVDMGITLDNIIEYLSLKNPATLEICALLDKTSRRQVHVPVKYVGFEIPDEFVVGYGLDLDEQYRNLSFIGILQRRLV